MWDGTQPQVSARDWLAGYRGVQRKHGKLLNSCRRIDQQFVDLRESLLYFLARGYEPEPTVVIFSPGHDDLPHIQ